MKVFKFQVEIYVQGETAEGALAHMQEEFDYHFGQDNQLQAAHYLDNGVLEEDLEASEVLQSVAKLV